MQHLFTDGAGILPCVIELTVCAWSVVNASSGLVVSCGPLQGVLQSVPRAETSAVLSAVVWVRRHEVRSAIWCDAKHVAGRLESLLAGEYPATDWANYDLWLRIWQLLQDMPAGLLVVQHVPSHLDIELCTSPFEE